MTNLVTAIIGVALVSLFLGIMIWWVKALPLIIIVVGVMLLLLTDVVQSLRTGNDRDTK